jgi:S-adenosylmethionine synthetase
MHIDCQGTATVPESTILAAIEQTFDMTPAGVISSLDLLRPIYSPTAAHGHFGRTPDDCVRGSFSWERTDKVGALQKAAKLDAASV